MDLWRGCGDFLSVLLGGATLSAVDKGLNNVGSIYWWSQETAVDMLIYI